MEQTNRQFYKPSQAAEILQVSTRSLYRIIEEGTISVVRLMGDRRIRIPAKALDKLADSAEMDLGYAAFTDRLNVLAVAIESTNRLSREIAVAVADPCSGTTIFP